MNASPFNEPAFPVQDAASWQAHGMTLRDYFAEGAMRAFISTANGNCLGGLDGYENETAEAAYRMADAMLKARGQA